jgi:hypothetical protein
MATPADRRPPRRRAVTRPVPRGAAAAAAALLLPGLAACTPRSDSSSSSSSARTRVVIRADDGVCWTATVDGRRREGCGDAEFTDRGGRGTAKVVKTSGGSSVRVRLVVDGRVVDRGSVREAHSSVRVETG